MQIDHKDAIGETCIGRNINFCIIAKINLKNPQTRSTTLRAVFIDILSPCVSYSRYGHIETSVNLNLIGSRMQSTTTKKVHRKCEIDGNAAWFVFDLKASIRIFGVSV